MNLFLFVSGSSFGCRRVSHELLEPLVEVPLAYIMTPAAKATIAPLDRAEFSVTPHVEAGKVAIF